MKHRLTSSAYTIFFMVLSCSLVAQSVSLFSLQMLDLGQWANGAEQMLAGRNPELGDFIFGYPGTLILLPSVLLIKLGLNSIFATNIIMVLSLSLFIAWTATLCFKLRKDTLWWAYASIILIANPCYVLSTPPSAHIAVLGSIFVLMTLYIYERSKQPEVKDFITLGIVGGLLLTSRFDFGLAYYFSAIIFLFRIHISYSIVSIFTAFSFSWIATPLLWKHPTSYFYDVFSKIYSHATSASIFIPRATRFEYYTNILTIYGSLALLIGIVLVFNKKTNLYIPRAFLAWLASFTIILLMILLKSVHHPPWLIYPIMVVWEALLPLLVLALMNVGIIKSKQSEVLLSLIAIGHILSYFSEIIVEFL